MLRVYDAYSSYGVDKYYEQFAHSYYNPHEQKIIQILDNCVKKYLSENTTFLDFACGDGLISRYIKNNFNNVTVEGSDPYFVNEHQTYNFSFDDIIHGKATKFFDVVICCYAYHLLDLNKRHDFLTQLSLITNKFIIISPSKKINIDHELWDVIENIRIDKVTIIIIQVKKFD